MDIHHLEQIVEICRVGSFSGAARRMGISQPALSKSIGRLEAELSVKLFERDSGAARPTEFASLILDRAEGLLTSMRAIRHDIELFARGDTGLLRVGVSTMTRLRPLPQVIRHTAAAYPRLQIEIYNQPAQSLFRGLRAGRYDLIFCNADAAVEEQDLIRIKLFQERRVLITRPDHPLVNTRPLTPEVILKYPMASFGMTKFKEWAGEVSPEAERNMSAFMSSERSLIRELLLERDYFGCSAVFPFESELRKGTLVELPISDLPLYECWMLTTEARWRLPIVKSIADIAKRSVRHDAELPEPRPAAKTSPRTRKVSAKRKRQRAKA